MKPVTCLLGAMLALASSLQAQGWVVTEYGPDCGPRASGTIRPTGATWRFAFTMSNAQPNTPVLLIVGGSQTSTPINFGQPCFLLTELYFTQSHRTDSTGSYTWSHALSATFRGQACVQFAEITFDAQNQLQVRTTNGVSLVWM